MWKFSPRLNWNVTPSTVVCELMPLIARLKALLPWICGLGRKNMLFASYSEEPLPTSRSCRVAVVESVCAAENWLAALSESLNVTMTAELPMLTLPHALTELGGAKMSARDTEADATSIRALAIGSSFFTRLDIGPYPSTRKSFKYCK